MERVKAHHRALVLTEEPATNTFAQAVAGKIQSECFRSLDAPVRVMGSEDTPAIPLNKMLEATLLPNADKVRAAMEEVLNF